MVYVERADQKPLTWGDGMTLNNCLGLKLFRMNLLNQLLYFKQHLLDGRSCNFKMGTSVWGCEVTVITLVLLQQQLEN